MKYKVGDLLLRTCRNSYHIDKIVRIVGSEYRVKCYFCLSFKKEIIRCAARDGILGIPIVMLDKDSVKINSIEEGKAMVV